MEEIQSWLENSHNSTSTFSKYSSPPSSETHSTLCEEEDSSFESKQIIISISHSCIAKIKTTTPQITCLAAHDGNLYAATINEINVFDLTTLSHVHAFGSGSGWAKSIVFNNGKIFTAHQDCKIRVWKKRVTPASSSTSSKRKPYELISTLPTLKDRMFKCMLEKNYVQVRRHRRKLWIQHADAVSGLALNEEDGLLYSVSWDKSLKAWKTTSGGSVRCLESVTAHSDAVNAVAVNPLDGTVITGSADGRIKIWKEHKLVTTLSGHESSVNALVLGLVGRAGPVLFSGGGDCVINVWNKGDDGNDNDNGNGNGNENENGNGNGNGIENENESGFVFCCSMKGHKGAILSLVHVKGVLISGSSDRSVRIWKHGNGYSGVCLAVMEGHCKPVKSVVAIPGDLERVLTVYSGSLDGEIRAWKVVVCNDSD